MPRVDQIRASFPADQRPGTAIRRLIAGLAIDSHHNVLWLPGSSWHRWHAVRPYRPGYAASDWTASGNRTVNAAPPEGAGPTSMVPPWAATSSWQM